MIYNARLLISELERMVDKVQFDDFDTEYITIDIDENEYLVDAICMRQCDSDPPLRHLCIKATRPTDIGGGIIR